MTRAAQSRVFVDGNNVMGSRPDGWWRDRAEAARRLVAEIIPLALGHGGAWTIVFDSSSTVSADMRRLRSNKNKGLGVDQRDCPLKCSGKF